MTGFHLLNYTASLGAAAADSALAGSVDDEITRNVNNNYIFTEGYNLIGAYYLAASATRARFNVPAINALTRHQIWPLDRSATIPADPWWQDLRDAPMPLPQNEPLGVEGSNDAAGADQANAFLWIAPPAWSRQIPRGLQRVTARFTSTVTRVANAWSAVGAMTFSDGIRGGWYSVVGATLVEATTLAFRIVFPKGPINRLRRLRPGALAQQATGNLPIRTFAAGLGWWGAFHSFETPQIQVFANAAGAGSQEGRIDLIWHGDVNPGVQ